MITTVIVLIKKMIIVTTIIITIITIPILFLSILSKIKKTKLDNPVPGIHSLFNRQQGKVTGMLTQQDLKRPGKRRQIPDRLPHSGPRNYERRGRPILCH